MIIIADSNKISEYIKGVVYLTASDGFVDIFLSECRRKNIKIKDFHKQNDGLFFKIDYSEFNNLKKAAELSGMRLKIIKRKGLPILFFRYRKRYGIPLGLLLSLIIYFILSSMIWSIDIKGNIIVSDEELNYFLQENGIRTGQFSETISGNDLEFMIENSFENVSWVSASVIGSRLLIEIKEREIDPSESSDVLYSNIVAAKDGEIISADIFCGDGSFYPGSAVLKGDLLVNGVKTYNDGRVEFVRSSAVIKAVTHNHIISHSAKNIRIEKPENIKVKYYPIFFSLSGITKDNENGYYSSTEYFIKSADIKFPIGIKRVNSAELKDSEIVLSDIQSLLISFADYSENCLELFKKCEILSRQTELTFEDNLSIEGSFKCIEDIAFEKEFTVDTTE